MNILRNFFGWLFGTRGGWIAIGISTFVGCLVFCPEVLGKLIKKILEGILGLVGVILSAALSGLAKIIQANQTSLEYLFLIVLMGFGIVLMLRGIFGRKGGRR